MTDLLYPTSAELTEIAQDLLPRLTTQRAGFDICPMVDEDAGLVMWEQEDVYTGLQQVRGLGGAPGRVAKTAMNRFQMIPGSYGEFALVDEVELTLRRQFGTFGTPVDISDLVLKEQRKLLNRRLDRIEWIIWTLFSTGTFSVAGPDGTTLHTDTYTPQTFTAGTSWATTATSTPHADLRAVMLDMRGHSVDFGPGAKLFLNRKTTNNLLNNTNSNDLFGRRVQGLTTINNLNMVNTMFAGDGLPQIVEYDAGYLADVTKTFTPYIPDNKFVLVGKRTDGSPVANYKMVRNANNPGLAPGAYMKVIDRGENEVPRRIEIHDGHNGGIALTYPSAIVIGNV